MWLVGAARGPLASAARPEQPTPAAALATPIGDGRRALVTKSAAAETDGDLLDVFVPSGRIVDGRVVDALGDTYVVELAEAEAAHSIASEMPAGDAMVIVMTDPPIEVPLDDLSQLQVDEGTAVLDGKGDLVGLCSDDEGRTRLIEVSAGPAAATSADR